MIEQLELSRPEIVHVFDQLVRTTPDGIYLTSVKQTDRTIELKGVAQSSTRVASYMRNIDSSEWLKDPALQILETKGASDAGSQFTLTATQENPQVAAATDQNAAPGQQGPARESSRPVREVRHEHVRRPTARPRSERSEPLAAGVPARRHRADLHRWPPA